ncbi:hypothetical protein ACWCP6_26455 [Streptomyces sp. NPDC002004]
MPGVHFPFPMDQDETAVLAAEAFDDLARRPARRALHPSPVEGGAGDRTRTGPGPLSQARSPGQGPLAQGLE